MALGKNMKVDRLIPLNQNSEEVNKQDDFLFELNLNDSSINDSSINDSSINDLVNTDENKVTTFPEISLDLSEQSVTSEIKSEELDANPKAIENVNEINEVIEVKSEIPSYENIELENLKIIFTPSRRKTQKRILISIEGSLTINNVELLYSKVNLVFDYFDFVEVNLNNISEIDLTVIQLFHAIRVNYWPQKKYISINAEFSRDDRKLLNSCGFTEFQTQIAATV
jgi:hypothetical protein